MLHHWSCCCLTSRYYYSNNNSNLYTFRALSLFCVSFTFVVKCWKKHKIFSSLFFIHLITYNSITLYFGRESRELNSKLMWHCHRFFFIFYFLCFVLNMIRSTRVVTRVFFSYFFGKVLFFLFDLIVVRLFVFVWLPMPPIVIESGQQTDGL